MRDALQHILEGRGYSVTCAADGSEAIDALRNAAYKLVVTDLIMPVADGFDVVRHLVRHRPGTPLILISGGGRLDALRHLALVQGLGVAAMLAKPFTALAFEKTVTAVAGEG